MKRIIKNDEVIIKTGKNKGQQGKVIKVLERKVKRKRGHLPITQTYVIVEGMNLIKKHVKPNPQINQQGGIVEKEAPIHISNVAIFNSATGKADKVGFKYLDDKSKVRYFKSTDEVIS